MADVYTILCVEVDPATRYFVERMLKGGGYNVLIAQSGKQGIALAHHTPPDLVLVCSDLPDMGSSSFVKVLRTDANLVGVAIVALIHRDAQLDPNALFTGYIRKPIDIEQFFVFLNSYLHNDDHKIKMNTERLFAAQVRYTRELVENLEKRIDELKAGNEALIKLDKMKENFIQITAHELRTPLTLVFGYSRLLEDHPPMNRVMEEDSSVRSLMNGLHDAIFRMHAMVEEILITARIMTNQIEISVTSNNLSDMIENVIASYQRALRDRNLEILFDVEEWPRRFNGDSEMMRVVFSNLLGNAIKYTPDGGKIFLHAQIKGANFEFSIRDTGIGISLEDQGKIFQEFYTLGDSNLHTSSKTAFQGGGLGLGLPVCKGIVEAHGGNIRVESQGYDPDICPGSRFIITLPISIENARMMPIFGEGIRN